MGKAKIKTEAKRVIAACKGCDKDAAHVDMCRIRNVCYEVFFWKCPREVELEAEEKARNKATKKTRRKRK